MAEQMQMLIDRADADKLKKAAERLRQGSTWSGADRNFVGENLA